MHNVFHNQPIVENLPLKINCIQAYENKVIVGTDHGSLLLYSIEEDPVFTITLSESRVSSSRKGIDQLCLIPGTGDVAVLSDGAVTVYEIATLAVRTQIQKAKGVTLIAAPVAAQFGESESPTSANSELESRFCFATKRKVSFIKYNGSDVVLDKEVTLSDRPRTMLWLGQRLYIGFARSLSCVDVTTGAVKDLYSFRTSLTAALGSFAPVKTSSVLVTPFSGDRVLATKDNTTLALDHNGQVSQDLRVEWSSGPEAVAVWSPYLVGLFTGHLEVRRTQSNTLVQTIPLPNANMMIFGASILVASQASVWRLLPLDFEDQIEQLVTAGQFAEAKNLIEELDFPTEEDKTANIIRVRGMYAHHIFTTEHKYQEALSILKELQASPLDVINLYPDLSPPDPDGGTPEPAAPSDKKAMYLLMNYLSEQRAVLAKLRQQQEYLAGMKQAEPPDSALQAQYPVLADTLYLSEVVDTTLLKVYLSINEALVGSLLRVPNACNVEESEQLLLERQKYDELVDLYRGKGLHRNALDFLMRKASSPESTAAEVEKMVTYLHGINFEDNLDLILEYAAWILKRDSEEGIKIFTEHYDEVSPKARKGIVSFLETISEDFAIRYLEYLIHDLHDHDAELHDQLISCYLSKLKRDLSSKTGYDGPMLPKRSGADNTEDGRSFWTLRRKLAAFLEESQNYHAEQALASFPTDALYEERAMVLSRLKRHEEALRIYIEKVRNYHMANVYCEKHYDPDDPESQDVFLILLQLYLNMVQAGDYPLADVMTFLGVYGASMDATKALPMLPGTIQLKALLGYFQRCLHDMHRTRNMNEVVKNLLKAECLQFQERLTHYSTKRIRITDDRMCPICLKRIANSVFTCFPNGVVTHAYCAVKK
ncbi:uncharacterized protein SPPG_03886 [Spizellomyces punctatus DAOM BR117]|uniref:CNH domain-containing protein n=1 Tax=Spizellomyces punctatus (strain DAOM BR117) TaxID=645134 RepID=A0A0L0HI65_SPIPD|nr:uncharacterized protein SPPG_03886 [Spizellomyces punctatus DAOM BR117]KND00773.1 hypothetical protein SPPG_03886 [Spizellomyces punctatus DAOM BR117]|eukprot:XP_016608812.1 hypothetical protein SPPG_03886 [Spizellomyces punctatus DAOM BR117]